MHRWKELTKHWCYMIGKWSKDWKADWLEAFISNLVHANNSMRLAITGYSLHYLMFGCQPWLTHWLLFLHMIRGTKNTSMYEPLLLLSYVNELWEAFKEAQVQSMSEAERQKWYYDRKANAISLEPGNLVLAKAKAYRGRRKVMDWVGEGIIWSGVPGCWGHPFLPHEEPADRMLMSPPPKLTFPHCSYGGDSSLYSSCELSGPGAPQPP